MFRDRSLRVVLVLAGLMFLSGVFALLHYNNPARAFEQMLSSVYATLGVFLIIAAFNPPAHRSLIAFTAWSSIVHGAVMAIQAVKGGNSAQRSPASCDADAGDRNGVPLAGSQTGGQDPKIRKTSHSDLRLT